MLASKDKISDVMTDIIKTRLSSDRYTFGHTQRVTDVTLSLGRAEGLLPDRLEELRLAALLHDIGKIAIAPKILNKPGPLTPEEYIHIMEHIAISCNIAYGLVSERVLEIISHHHDRYDGNGLNQTTAGKDIPLAARILTIADAFDAMVSTRPYKIAMSHKEAMREIANCAGTQFDPMMAEKFINIPLDRTYVFGGENREREEQSLVKKFEDGHMRPLDEFAQCAIIYLQQNPESTKVVQLAKNIMELKNNTAINPSFIYELPEGYDYNIGEFIAVVRKENKNCAS